MMYCNRIQQAKRMSRSRQNHSDMKDLVACTDDIEPVRKPPFGNLGNKNGVSSPLRTDFSFGINSPETENQSHSPSTHMLSRPQG